MTVAKKKPTRKRQPLAPTITEMVIDLEAQLERLRVELPERVYALYLEGWADGQKNIKSNLDPIKKMELYGKAVERVRRKRGK